jgi:hypothetical protein
LFAVLRDLDGVLFKIEQVSDIVLEAAQPLHDKKTITSSRCCRSARK